MGLCNWPAGWFDYSSSIRCGQYEGSVAARRDWPAMFVLSVAAVLSVVFCLEMLRSETMAWRGMASSKQ